MSTLRAKAKGRNLLMFGFPAKVGAPRADSPSTATSRDKRMLRGHGRVVTTLHHGGLSGLGRRPANLSGNPHRHAAPRERPVAQLPLLVVSPAIDYARRREPTRVVTIGTHARKRQSARYGHRREVVRCRAITELAVRVPAPTVGGVGADAELPCGVRAPTVRHSRRRQAADV